MKSQLDRHQLIGGAAALLLLLAACSGGESGTGVQANQTTVGEITGFGSVYVNGIKFNTDQATVKIDGVAASENNLSVGMVITVIGGVNSDGVNGTANTVSARTEVEGLVWQNNIVSDGTINVMGQIVHISNDTKFKSEVGAIAVVTDLVAGDTIVQVSGFSDGQGNIYATYVKATGSGSASEVKLHGVISNLDGDADSGSFNVGNISVTYDTTTVFEDFGGITNGGGLANGIYVAVTSHNYAVAGAPVQAAEIGQEDLSTAAGTELEMEGIVTDASNVAVGSGQFVLNGKAVNYDISTSFEGGVAMDISAGMKLEVHGVAHADGSILADEIDFRAESDTEIEGTVFSAGVNTLTITD
ncbi:MAG TPA: DUF5666 domain-containing protein, partial [Gammaproteobacteria bacterium]